MEEIFANLVPDQRVTSILEVDFEALAARGIYCFILDVDSTIAHHYSDSVNQAIKAKLQEASGKGSIARIVLLSNIGISNGKRRQRVAKMAAEIKAMDYVCAVGIEQKPSRRAFRRALKMMRARAWLTVMIGDQILTDIWGAKRLNIYTIKVDPLGRDHFTTIPKRWVEKILLWLEKKAPWLFGLSQS